ncbi:MAG: hypothetical protein ACYTGW_16310 [Planctomycetota bacterium]
MATRTHNNKRAERQGPRFNEVLAVRIGVTITATLGVVLLASIFFIPTEIKVMGHGNHQSAAKEELLQELQLLRTTWEPKARQRILDRAPTHAEYFAGPLHRILRMQDPKMLEQAVEYAGALAASNLRPTLVRLATSPKRLPPGVRSKAMKAAERLGPWPSEKLAEFLTEGTPPVKLAALEISGKRRDAPWPEVLEVLTNGGDSTADKALTAAAIQAIPEIAPKSLVTALWEMVALGDAESVIVGLQAFRRTKLDPDMQKKLAGQLELLDSEAQLICLSLLGSSGHRLVDAGPVWALIQSTDTEPQVRARALYCLEQTCSFEVEQLRKQVFFMDPLAKYFAARCLVAANQNDGPEILLDLVDAEEVDLSVASRRMLAWLTGKGPGTSRTEFRNSLPRLSGKHAARKLPAPGYDFESSEQAPAKVSPQPAER